MGGPQPLAKVHAFVWDRTRSIRNDFTLQNVPGFKTRDLLIAVECYEIIARFHMHSLHQLSRPNIDDQGFTAHNEREQLNKTLLSLMEFYDLCAARRATCVNEPEFRAYNILMHFHNQDVERQAMNLARDRKDIFEHPRIQTALELYAAVGNIYDRHGPLRPAAPIPIAQNSFGKFFRLVKSKRVSYSMACMAEIHFNHIRMHALGAARRAYKSRSTIRDCTMSLLVGLLGFDTQAQAQEFCEACGMNVSESTDGVRHLDLTDRLSELRDPNGTIKQPYSVSLVESKRHGRTLPQVIHGVSVRDAREAMKDSATGEGAPTQLTKVNSSTARQSRNEKENTRNASAITGVPVLNSFTEHTLKNAPGAQRDANGKISNPNPFAPRSPSPPWGGGYGYPAKDQPVLSLPNTTSSFGTLSLLPEAATPSLGFPDQNSKFSAGQKPSCKLNPMSSPFAPQSGSGTKMQKTDSLFVTDDSDDEDQTEQSTKPQQALKSQLAPSIFSQSSFGSSEPGSTGFNPFASKSSTVPALSMQKGGSVDTPKPTFPPTISFGKPSGPASATAPPTSNTFSGQISTSRSPFTPPLSLIQGAVKEPETSAPSNHSTSSVLTTNVQTPSQNPVKLTGNVAAPAFSVSSTNTQNSTQFKSQLEGTSASPAPTTFGTKVQTPAHKPVENITAPASSLLPANASSPQNPSQPTKPLTTSASLGFSANPQPSQNTPQPPDNITRQENATSGATSRSDDSSEQASNTQSLSSLPSSLNLRTSQVPESSTPVGSPASSVIGVPPSNAQQASFQSSPPPLEVNTTSDTQSPSNSPSDSVNPKDSKSVRFAPSPTTEDAKESSSPHPASIARTSAPSSSILPASPLNKEHKRSATNPLNSSQISALPVEKQPAIEVPDENSEIPDKVVSWMLSGKDGLLDQYISYILPEIVKSAYDEYNEKQAIEFRERTLMVRYLYRWKFLAERKAMISSGRERRKRMSEFILQQRQKKLKRKSDPILETYLQETRANRQMTESSANSRHKRSHTMTDPKSLIQEASRSRKKQRSASPPPEKPSPRDKSSIRSSAAIKKFLNPRFPKVPFLSGDSILSSSTLAKARAVLGDRGAVDKTRSDVWRLKAAGLVTLPNGVTQPINMPVPSKKRGRDDETVEDESSDRKSTAKVSRRSRAGSSLQSAYNSAVTRNGASSTQGLHQLSNRSRPNQPSPSAQNVPARSRNAATSNIAIPSPSSGAREPAQASQSQAEDDEDAQLFAQMRRLREAMDEGIEFYRSEIEQFNREISQPSAYSQSTSLQGS